MKNTMGTKLPRKPEQKMQTVGEQIKLARLHRNLRVLYALLLDDDILNIAREDPIGRCLS